MYRKSFAKRRLIMSMSQIDRLNFYMIFINSNRFNISFIIKYSINSSNDSKFMFKKCKIHEKNAIFCTASVLQNLLGQVYIYFFCKF